jgi:hypothetical protein
LEVNRRFIKFAIGWLLFLGSIFFALYIGWPWALLGFGTWDATYIFEGIIDTMAFIGGIYLIATIRRR